MTGRWNFSTREYEPYTIPADWVCPLGGIDFDFDQIVNCAECGRELPYGQTFTSMRIHTPMGLGFGVCETCYSAEHDARWGNSQ